MGKNISGVYLANEKGVPQPHHIHRDWLESVDATQTIFEKRQHSGLLKNSFLEDFRGEVTDIDEKADIYVVENPGALYHIKELKKKNPTAKIVFLHATHRMNGLEPYNLHKEDVHNGLRSINHLIESFLLNRKVSKYVDHIITVSKMMKEDLRDRFPHKPIDVVCPYPQEGINVTPDLESKKAIFVGRSGDYKGVDLLANSWESVRDEYPCAELFIVGRGHTQQYESIEGVNVEGYVENLDDAFEGKSLYIHPARFDPFALTPIEAMKGGFPALVSTKTGAKSEVTKIDSKLLTEPSPKNIADSIISYFNENKENKIKLSEKAHKIANQTKYMESEEKFRDILEGLKG